MDTEKVATLLHRKLTEAIIGAAYEVHRELGSGFLEKVYEPAMAVELADRGIPFKQQAGMNVLYKKRLVGHYVADLLVDGKVMCEFKVADGIAPGHEAQLLNYLKATGIRVGLILNFGRDRLQFKRLVR